MKDNPVFLIIAGTVLLIVGCNQSPVGEMEFPEGRRQAIQHN